jgi:hypothetical protein
MAATAKSYDSPNTLRADGKIGMRRFFNRLNVVVDCPLTQLPVGLGLVLTGATEIYGDMIDESRRFRVGAHQGIDSRDRKREAPQRRERRRARPVSVLCVFRASVVCFSRLIWLRVHRTGIRVSRGGGHLTR